MANLPMPLGLDKKDLECVMLQVAPFDIVRGMGEYTFVEDNELFYGDPDSNLKYAQGIVGDHDAHCTLLFGIHPSDDYEEKVWVVLDGWDYPQLLIDEITFFPDPSGENQYKVIKANVVLSQALMAGRQRLKVLPHTDDFPTYNPHITLAYIKGDADHEKWIERLNSAFGHKFVDVIGLDLGNN